MGSMRREVGRRDVVASDRQHLMTLSSTSAATFADEHLRIERNAVCYEGGSSASTFAVDGVAGKHVVEVALAAPKAYDVQKKLMPQLKPVLK